jgi:hypothetical protein
MMRQGKSRETVEVEERKQLGSVAAISEQGRKVWLWLQMEGFIAEVLQALISLWRNPSLIVLSVGMLAHGVGASALILDLGIASGAREQCHIMREKSPFVIGCDTPDPVRWPPPC